MTTTAQEAYILRMLDLIESETFQSAYERIADKELFRDMYGAESLRLRKQFVQDLNEAKAKEADDASRKAFEKQQEQLAKALPGMTSGTLRAISAFESGDAIGGSAAIMDICASLAPFLGSLATAGGPPGMLVGAIFSMIGQILAFFAPKQQSLTSQIDNLLRNLAAEQKAVELQKARSSIEVYVGSLKRAGNLTSKAPLLDTDLPNVLTNIIKDVNPIEGNTIDHLNDVFGWLDQKNNQTQDRWPDILAGYCHACSELCAAITTLVALASTDGMLARFDAAETLPPAKRDKLRSDLETLRQTVKAKLQEYAGVIDIQRRQFDKLRPAAQNWGMLWQIGSSGGYLYGGTKVLEGDFAYLHGQARRIAAAASSRRTESSRPSYDVFHLSNAEDGRIYHGVSKERSNREVAWEKLASLPEVLTDIWATPGPPPHEDQTYFYTASGKRLAGYVLDQDRKVTGPSYNKDLTADAHSVRVIHNPTSLVDDPDAGSPGPVLSTVAYLTYGGCKSSANIYVDVAGTAGYVPSPWAQYTGLAIDDHFVWVFRPESLACATHASVVRCRNGALAKPRWMEHTIPDSMLYTDTYRDLKKRFDIVQSNPLRGLLDVGPCNDGTLVAFVARRSALINPTMTRQAIAYDEPEAHMFNSPYKADLRKGTLGVPWTEIPHARGTRVAKLPAFFWPLYESANASMAEIARELP